MKRMMTRSLGFALICATSAAQAGPALGGAFITDRLGYSGIINRFGSLNDAQGNGESPIDQIQVTDRDLSLGVVSNDSYYIDNSHWMFGSWWYTTDPQGRDGWGNTTGNTGTGFLQLIDYTGATDTSISMSFGGFDGNDYDEFSLDISGENAGAAEYARLSTTSSNTHDSGVWHQYDLSMTVTGLNGDEVSPGVIESFDHPTGVTGTITGIFENTTGTANDGFYSIDFTLSMDNWAWNNRNDLTNDGGFLPSEFRTVSDVTTPVPLPGILGLFSVGLLLLGRHRLMRGNEITA